MIFSKTAPALPSWHKQVSRNYRCDEDTLVEELLNEARLEEATTSRIRAKAHHLVEVVRKGRRNQGGIDAFMQQYDLSTQEGLVLMCLAEALLRIPDSDTADALIEDKLTGSHWENYLGQSESIFVNASTLGLMITGNILKETENPTSKAKSIWRSLVKRSGEPVIRQAMRQAMRIMGFQFVLGRTIEEALKRADEGSKKGYAYSFDMLGEAARTHEDAQRYFKSYEKAIAALSKHQKGRGPVKENGISVKLSALHPRYELSHRERVLSELVPMVLTLAQQAKAANIGFTIDAEEAGRLEISLEVIEQVFSDSSLDGWDGFTVVVQAYQKRARDVLEMLADLCKRTSKKMMIRLVKGAYWDSEVKLSQELGLSGYPVFTRKAASDVSYLVCAKKLFSLSDYLYPQFATHNAYSAATILEISQGKPFEFQRLHGMGDALYEQLVQDHTVRIYAPVGSHEDLLSYLVRRLLENGANSSFVNRLVDDKTPIDDIIADPVQYLDGVSPKRHPHIPLPIDLYGSKRKNSKGIDLTFGEGLLKLQTSLESFALPVQVPDATTEEIEAALTKAESAKADWSNTPPERRGEILRTMADLLESNCEEFMAICIQEAGKTIPDSIAEVREAVDFLHYYADQAVEHFDPSSRLKARGTFVCISPWNFPLAIFIGQVSAALAAGNCVIAKPAEQTQRVAARMQELIYQAGVPKDAFHLLCGDGAKVGGQLLSDPRINGVCFTGSNQTANIINTTLANRSDDIVPLIAETGGQNAMIIDSSALLEATVADAVYSAFGSAGQRCSALRVAYIQDDVADRFIELLKGAIEELSVGDPSLLSTDVGPVIDDEALSGLESHVVRMTKKAKLLYACKGTDFPGHFLPPHAFEISSINDIGREVFGPVLHVVRYASNKLDEVIDEINSTGFGLTFGIHSRIENKTLYVQSRIRAGNCYINRNMTGAVVGVQPFGGEGLSGTGPKAGGPHYLLRFATQDNEDQLKDLNGLAMLGLDLKDSKNVQAIRTAETDLPTTQTIGKSTLDQALDHATRDQEGWNKTPAVRRSTILRTVADRLDNTKTALISACLKTNANDVTKAATDVGEAIAALRYYANLCDAQFSSPDILPGPTGEHNELQLHGRGTLACLSRDSNSLAEFVAQISAALASGNIVVAQTATDLLPLAGFVVQSLYDAGLPFTVLQLCTGNDDAIEAQLLSDLRINGVCYAGPKERKLDINRTLIKRDGAIIPLITELGSDHYIHRLVTERTMTINITASGGNASLLTLDENA